MGKAEKMKLWLLSGLEGEKTCSLRGEKTDVKRVRAEAEGKFTLQNNEQEVFKDPC